MNVDEIHEVIPITEDYGLWHPQEGVLQGHFSPRDNEKIHKIGQLRQGVSKVIEDANYSPDLNRKYVVADMVTGWGVSESVRHYYNIYGGSIEGKRVIVQGWGNVGAAAGFYITQAGAKVVGIIDRSGGIIKEDGFTMDEMTQLFNEKEGNKLASSAFEQLSFEEVNGRIWDLQAEVFLPCAASRLITQEQADRLIATGLEVIACGANVPFADEEIFFGPIAENVDNKISVVPDFISNCGMARVFAYLMQSDVELSDDAIFTDTSDIIRVALEKAHAVSSNRTKIAQTAFEIALKQLI